MSAKLRSLPKCNFGNLDCERAVHEVSRRQKTPAGADTLKLVLRVICQDKTGLV